MSQLHKVTTKFMLAGSVNHITPLGLGMINTTYRVSLNEFDTEYVLQKINHNIFKDVELLQTNIQRITNHIKQKLIESGETDIDRKTLTLVPSKDDKLYYFDGENYWRMMLLIPDALTFQAVTPEYAYQAGKSFGKFQSILADIPGTPLGETIPNFHNMEFRLTQFRKAVEQDKAGRLHEVGELVYEIEERANEMCQCQDFYNAGKLPKRINHCDTKVNNILFDREGNVLCVIDLDTAMPGFVMSDFGDFMRTAGNTGKEDDPNLENVSFDMDIYKSYTKGYLESAKCFLTELEISLLPFGAKLMTYMQLTRFLSDYLNGDTYYKIENPLHNLQRSKAQFKLLQSIESHYNDMLQFIINTIC